MNSIYIPRKLLEKERYYQYIEYFPFLESFFDLYSLIVSGKKKIVLLGDAGYGKSTELKVINHRLIKERNQNFIPIFIPLDTYVDEEIATYVRRIIKKESESIMDYDKSKMVFLFDGFDQVLNKQVATRRIKNFIEEYDKSTFIIACRTNFYSDQFDKFKIFVLLPFDPDDIRMYADQALYNESGPFLDQLTKYSLFPLAKNPFFLDHLIKIYETYRKIPISRSEVFSKIIPVSLEHDEERLSDKHDLRQTYPTSEIVSDLMYMSLIMETLQKNFVSIDEFNKIISDGIKRQIISELSLIKKSFFKEGYAYQFQHNNFQEYLAARKIENVRLNVIIEFISFRSVVERKISWIDKVMFTLQYVDFKPYGIKVDKIISNVIGRFKYKRIEKINPVWINTVAFLCQLRERKDLLNFLMRNDPELALKFEPDRLDDGTREKIFKTIFEKYTHRKIWLDRYKIDYDEMANFAKKESIYNYLMEFARLREHFIHRYNAIQMLGRIRGLGDDEALRILLIQYANDEKENQDVRHICFYALSWLGMDTIDTIDSLKNLKDSGSERVISGLYYLIKESEHTDQYVDILLSGIPKMHSSFVDLRLNLTEGLEKIKSVDGIRNIIKYFINNPKIFHEFQLEETIEKIIANTIKAYNHDNSIYNDVKELAKALVKEYMIETIQAITKFFLNTGTSLKFFKEIYTEGIENNYGILASTANEQCIEFLTNEYLEKKISEYNIRVFTNVLSAREKSEFEHLLKIINKKTGNKFLLPPPKDYQKEQKEEMQKTVKIIFNREEFIREVENIFIGEDKEELNYDYMKDILFKIYKEKRYSEFVVKELARYFEKYKDKKLSQDELIKEINQWDYEWFAVWQIFNLLYHRSELDLSREQNDFIKHFCLNKINEVNFREALKQKNGGFIVNNLAIILWYFLRKYDLEYPKRVLLDMLSFDWIEEHQYVGIDYIINKLLPEKIKERILENLNKGIKVDQVLKNHVYYCRKHKIHEAKNQLMQITESPEIPIENRLFALETLADFPESKDFLENLLETNELRLFIKAAKILLKRDNNRCKKTLIQKLKCKDEKFALESAKLLIKDDLRAIKYYADYIKRTKKFKVDLHDKNPLQNINTIKALPILFDLLKFNYQHPKEIQQDKFYSLDYVIFNLFKKLAIKSPKNFYIILKKLKKFINKYESRFEGANFLNVVYDDIEKAFFANYPIKITINDAINKVNRLCNRRIV